MHKRILYLVFAAFSLCCAGPMTAQTLVCPADTLTVCDTSSNNAALWNDPTLWDAIQSEHNLSEAVVSPSIEWPDSCQRTVVQYELALDLDLDGTPETVISSANPAASAVPFDQRPVGARQKYRFALERSTGGGKTTARVRWNTDSLPAAFVDPQLPYGRHTIRWTVTDSCRQSSSSCTYMIDVRDCKPPVVVAANGFAANIAAFANPSTTIWAKDILLFTQDNASTTAILEKNLSVRRRGAGQGYPTGQNGQPVKSLTYTCADAGQQFQFVEIWTKDAAGNSSFAETYVLVQDLNKLCRDTSLKIPSGRIADELNRGVEGVEITIKGAVPTGQPSPNLFPKRTDSLGIFHLNINFPIASSYVVTPFKNEDPLNGVSSFDIALISRHISGAEPLNTPYKMIAADINKSGSITAFDLVELRRLILGINEKFPENTSWRFVDRGFVFENAQNPFTKPFPEVKSLADIRLNSTEVLFTGIKIGDVNNSAKPNRNTEAPESVAHWSLPVAGQSVKVGDVVEMRFQAPQELMSWQFTLEHPALTLLNIQPDDLMDSGNFARFPGALTTAWDGNGNPGFRATFQANESGTLKDMLVVSDRITRAEACANAKTCRPVVLDFTGALSTGDAAATAAGVVLGQNTPNPFSEGTVIPFELPQADAVTLAIVDVTGRTLWSHSGYFAAGQHTVAVPATAITQSAVLFYRLQTTQGSLTRSMVKG